MRSENLPRRPYRRVLLPRNKHLCAQVWLLLSKPTPPDLWWHIGAVAQNGPELLWREAVTNKETQRPLEQTLCLALLNRLYLSERIVW